MYSVPQSQQLFVFLCSLGLGFLMGIFYDVFRAIRLVITSKKVAVIIFDVMYLLTVAVTTFLFILALNKGEVRIYILVGEFIGWTFYYLAFGLAVVKVTDAFVSLFRRFLRMCFSVLSAPFRLVGRLTVKFIRKTHHFFKKMNKKSCKILKKLLPKLYMYVYNLFGILSVRRNRSKKGGVRFGKDKISKTQKGPPL